MTRYRVLVVGVLLALLLAGCKMLGPTLCASLLIAGFVFPFGVSEGRL